MKNIYEDGEHRSDMEDIGSSGKPDGFSGKERDGANNAADRQGAQAAAPSAGQGAPVYPALQLTPEQISALLAQLMAAQSNGLVSMTAPEGSSQPSAAVPTPPAGPNDPGTRIIFQSPDFDEPASEKATVSLESVMEGDSEAEDNEASVQEKRQSFYDDDDLFDREAASRMGLRAASGEPDTVSAVRTTDLGSEFSIAEMDIDGDELPELPQSRASVITPKASAPRIISEPHGHSAAKPVRIPSATGGTAQGTGTSGTAKKAFSSMSIEEIEEPEQEATVSDGKGKKTPVSEIIRRVVLVISIIAIVIASAVLLREYKLHKDNEKLEADMSNLIIDVPEETTTKKNNGNKDKNKNKNKPTTTEAVVETTLTAEQQWAQIRAQYPNVIFPPNLQLKYAKLYATNQEFVGYLSAEDVGLSLPIVQTTDDEKYLQKNFYGKNTKYGCPFVTHLNNIETLDMNTVIFGHHMNDSTVFGALDKYKSIDGFKKAPVITFNTLYKDHQWKIIAAFITNAYEKEDNGYLFRYYFTTLSTQERFAAYLNELNQRTLYYTGVDVQPTDKILTLSTCSHEFDEARFVVVARLVRPGESSDVNVELASVNASPRYPQAYYTKKKLNNPYKDAGRWEVG